MTEEKLIEALTDRDEAALVELERQLGRYCGAVAGGILADAGEVEQVLNDTWMQIWSSIPPNNPKHLKLYAARITRNLALNRLDYLKAGKRSALPVEELCAVQPDRNLDRQALKDALERFLRGLKPEYRQMFLRRYWYGDSLEEIARCFATPRSRVNGILHRTRRQLKDFLTKEELDDGTT